jgi:uncharacterized protein YyaL (SSP411 family)
MRHLQRKGLVEPAKVLWHDWSEETFQKAQSQDKPVMLYLGAFWCHGCRVMEETTYGDDEVVALLNGDYVALRVDSDRRPDINDRYNLGGWPTTAFLTPTGELIGWATFLDRDQMKQYLVRVKEGFRRERARIAEEIARRDEKIAQVLEKPATGVPQLTIEIFRKTVRGIVATFDGAYGGFGQAPKFPMIATLRVVLQALYETQGPDFQQVLQKTLDAMGDRGLFDSAAGGFFHYTTNDAWTSPRFEKMTEDNAGLIRLYLDASLVTGREKYAARAEKTLQWARSAVEDPERGVFFGSQYADEDYYLASPEARAKRSPPEVDRTVFTNSSSAMAAAYLRASQVLGDPRWAEVALRGLDFLLRECVGPEGVAHYYDGHPRVRTLLRDPIALGSALLDAFDHTGDSRWRDAAARVMEPVPSRFWWTPGRGLADRAVDALEQGELGKLRVNLHENSLAAENFARLWRLDGDEGCRQEAEKLLKSFPDFLDGYGHTTAEYALAVDWLIRPPTTVPPTGLREYAPRRLVNR